MIDEDALVAGIELIGRAGARVTEEGHRDPVTAVEALARRLLRGARCVKCGREIRLDSSPGGCRWRRNGPHYYRGCDGGRGGGDPINPNRADRRRRARRKANRG